MSSAIVSREVVARIRHDQVRMLVIVAELRRAAEEHENEQLVRLASSLASVLNENVSLVSGVLEAVVGDEPSRLQVRPRIRKKRSE